MSDPTPTTAPVVAPAIQVSANPLQDQVATGLRYGLLAVSAVAGSLGYTHVAGQASALLMAVAPVAGFAVFVWGQLRTRAMSKKSAAMANMLPNEKAVAL